jgi:hypothetical protein
MEYELIKKIAKKYKSRNKKINQDNKEQIVTNFINCIEPFIEFKDREEWNTKRKYKSLNIKLPFCINFFREFYPDRDWQPQTKEEQIWATFSEVIQKIYYRIRMYGNQDAIDLLLKIFGKDISIQLMNNWADNNIIVANRLKEVINELNSNRNCQELENE